MGFFPNYTNIYPELKDVLDTRVQKTNTCIERWCKWIINLGKNDSSSSISSGLIVESVHVF